MGGPAGAQVACPDADAGPQAGAARLARATECLIAAERGAAGARALADLQSSARGHVPDMVARGYLSNQSPDGIDQFERAARAGYTQDKPGVFVAEIFGWGAGAGATPRARVEAWKAD